MYIYMRLGSFAVQQKLPEHCKSTITDKIKITQKKKKKVLPFNTKKKRKTQISYDHVTVS